MLIRIMASILLVGVLNICISQQVQWASKVQDVSSEFYYPKHPKQYLSNQALGEPSLLPSNQSKPCVWTPLLPDAGEEFIHVSFEESQKVLQVVVVENFNLGAIKQVILYKEDNAANGFMVYENRDPSRNSNYQPLYIFLDKAFETKSIKIVLNTSSVSGYNCIDAIGISDVKEKIEVKVNRVAYEIEVEPELLSSAINSSDDELNPIISPDGQTLYFTKDFAADTDSSDQDVFFAQAETDGTFMQSKNVGPPLSLKGSNNALLSISPDGQSALVLNAYNKDGSVNYGVSKSVKSSDDWSFPEQLKIDDFYNNSKHGEYFLSNDQNVLLMTLDREEGFGSNDVYVSFRKEDNLWTSPKNLGAQINTAAAEVGPFLASDGVTMYYSTSGKPGYGGADLFMVQRLDDTWQNWSVPKNLGPGINDESFNAYYSIAASGDYAYFSSKSESTKNDIYRVKLPKEAKPKPVVLIKGTVKNELNNELIDTEIVYYDLDTGEEVGTARSTTQTGTYSFVLPEGKSYGFYARKEGYYAIRENIDVRELSGYQEIKRDLKLSPIELNKLVRLNNVFFKQGEAELVESSYSELESVEDLLKNNKKLHIRLEGHTDNVGSVFENIKLSQQRCEIIKKYLVNKGIASKRITTEGYGGAQPIADNRIPSERPKNRRVEFRIIKL